MDPQVELNQRPYGKAPDNFWSCATSACWATTSIFVLMLAAIMDHRRADHQLEWRHHDQFSPEQG
jgi:hypothetical protein